MSLFDAKLDLEGNGSSEDEQELRALPTGVIRKRKGWAGEEMELNHVLHDDDDEVETKTLKSQFQNDEVGVGYQHTGVKRQRGVGESMRKGHQPSKIIDMSKKESGTGTTTNNNGNLKSHTRKGREEEATERKELINDMMTDFISNDKLRNFKLEVERILKSGV